MAKKTPNESLYFLRRFLNQPQKVASICPSSRFLTKRMFDGLNLSCGDLLLEYGPGTGAFTVEVERMRARGLNVRYLGVEKNPGMYKFLVQRFPTLDFVLGDATDIVDICRARRLSAAAAVISGLPLIFFDQATLKLLFDDTRRCLQADGVFRTFSYLHSYPSPAAAELRALMTGAFEQFELGTPILRNLPPALVLTGRIPSQD